MTNAPVRSAIGVLYEDDRCLVVDKPPRLLVHRGPCNDRDTLVARVRRYLGCRTVHPIHRLDRQTSGVVLFAKDAEAARTLRRAFDARAVEKLYVAIVRGVAPPFADVEHALRPGRDGAAVPAWTLVRTLAVADVEPFPVSVVACQPLTGRTHQIRRHMAHLRRPVLMDANYGNSRQNRAFRARHGLARLGLHARLLAFPSPTQAQERVEAVADLAPDLRRVLASLGLSEGVVEAELSRARAEFAAHLRVRTCPKVQAPRRDGRPWA